MTDTNFSDNYYFSPNSAIWTINREQVLLLTGMRVLLMQLAHPMVAEAVYEHSYVFEKPILRLQRTLQLTLAMVYGTKREVRQAIADIEAAHRPAVGRIEESVGKHEAGAVYNPRNPRQALWVFATLTEGAIFGYEKLVSPLSNERKDEFFENSRTIAEWMGIRASYIPKNYSGLLNYMQEAIETKEVCVSEKARKIGPFVTAQSILAVNVATYPLFRFNIALLPEAIRQQYGYSLPSWEDSLINHASSFSRMIVPRLPNFLRFMPQYRRALST
jgi:uncharacterized protein (DUF2236 family)